MKRRDHDAANTSVNSENRHRANLVRELSEPFGKALGAFVNSVMEAAQVDEAEFAEIRHRLGSSPHREVTEDLALREAIVAWMQHFHINQQQLAEKMGKSAPAVSRMLSNIENSKVSTLREIAKALDISLSRLLAGPPFADSGD